ncbi:MAG: bacterial Ig-like domain-containing protein [Treponema sp.]|jgi:hypothetical protein|nr:bacterial Ig-like domain-containing protein [Treponema sp.]
MKNFRLLIITGTALVIGMVLAGCKSMRLDHLETDTVTGPPQVRQGQDINPREVTVWGIYKNGERKVVSVTSREITFNKHTPGPQTVKIRVGILTSQEVSFMTEVMALRTLNVASQPRIALFKMGTEPDPAWPGLEIRGEWDQMGSDKIELTSCEITGYMKDQSGKQTIKVSYEGITTTFDVDVRGMTSLQIAQPPTKLDYFQGDTLDLTGLKVTGVWEGFPEEALDITLNDITGFNVNNVGIQHVSVNKNGKSAIFDVEVMALTSMEVRVYPSKMVYKVGEALELVGMVIDGKYTGADPSKSRTVTIPNDSLAVTGFDPNHVGTQIVTFTLSGVRFTIPVTVQQ